MCAPEISVMFLLTIIGGYIILLTATFSYAPLVYTNAKYNSTNYIHVDVPFKINNQPFVNTKHSKQIYANNYYSYMTRLTQADFT